MKQFSVYLASVCWSLQCLISALTQEGRGGLLFRFTCSVVLWGGRGTADKSHWPVWGALAVFQPHWVCPHSCPVCFPHQHCLGSRLLYRERALSWVWFQFLGTPQKQTPLGLHFVPSPAWQAQVARSLTSTLSLGAAQLLPSAAPALVTTHVGEMHLCLFWEAGL